MERPRRDKEQRKKTRGRGRRRRTERGENLQYVSAGADETQSESGVGRAGRRGRGGTGACLPKKPARSRCHPSDPGTIQDSSVGIGVLWRRMALPGEWGRRVSGLIVEDGRPVMDNMVDDHVSCGKVSIACGHWSAGWWIARGPGNFRHSSPAFPAASESYLAVARGSCQRHARPCVQMACNGLQPLQHLWSSCNVRPVLKWSILIIEIWWNKDFSKLHTLVRSSSS